MDFAFYNVTSVRGFASMLNSIFTKTVIIWLFPTEFKRAHVLIVLFIRSTLNN